jgi:hypothetical protein
VHQYGQLPAIIQLVFFWALTWTINRITVNHKIYVENGQFLQPNEEWTAVQHKLTQKQKHHKICCWKIFGRV